MLNKKIEWLTSLKEFIQFAFEEKKLGILVFLFSLIFPFAQLSFPLAFKEFINSLIYTPQFSTIIFWLLILFSAYFLINASTGLHNFFTEKYKQKVTIKLREKFMDHFLKIEMGYYTSKASGYFLQRMQESLQLRDLMADAFAGLIANSILFIVITIVMFRINFWIGVIFISAVPILIWTTFHPQKEVRNRSTASKEAEARLTEESQGILNNIEKIKAHFWESYIIREFIKKNKIVFAKAMRLIKWQIGWQTLGGITPVPFYFVAFVVCSILIVRKEMTLGTLVAVNQLANLLLQSGVNFARIYTQVQSSLPSCIRVFEILDSEPVIKDGFIQPSEVVAQKEKKIEIVVDKISFRYPDQTNFVFKNLDFKIRLREWICIAGKNGSGKSTFFKLVLRLFDPEKGGIYINGQNIKDYKLSYLRKIIDYDPQVPFLVAGTVMNNLKVAAPQKTEKEIEDQLANLGLKDFFGSLPVGFKTPITGEGRGLSSGQKQVIAFSRIFLKNADILLLDEPTASLDPFLEEILENALFKLRNEKTTLVIAHKPQTLQWADRIIIFDGGKVSDMGRHEELLKRNKIYQIYFKTLLEKEAK